MAYLSKDQLRFDVAKATFDNLTNAQADQVIERADREVRTVLGNVIDFSLVPADYSDATFPEFLNLYARCRAAQVALVVMFGAKRNVDDITDIQYWKKECLELYNQIVGGEVPLELADGTSIAGVTDTLVVAKSGIRPAFGLGEYGGFISETGLQEDRPTGSEYDEDYIGDNDVTPGDQ